MVSASYSNLLDLGANYPKDLSRNLPKLIGFSGNGEEENKSINANITSQGIPSSPSISSKKKTIIAADMLPLCVEKNASDGSWKFSVNEKLSKATRDWHTKSVRFGSVRFDCWLSQEYVSTNNKNWPNE